MQLAITTHSAQLTHSSIQIAVLYDLFLASLKMQRDIHIQPFGKLHPVQQ